MEVEVVLDATVSDPICRGDACHFEPAGRPARGIIVTVYWTGGEARMGLHWAAVFEKHPGRLERCNSWLYSYIARGPTVRVAVICPDCSVCALY
jgi:hypothetical protein